MTGASSPAEAATSTKCALKGRPEALGLANGFAVCVETPCASKRFAPTENAAPIPSWTNLRRPKLIAVMIPRKEPQRSFLRQCRLLCCDHLRIGKLQPEARHFL